LLWHIALSSNGLHSQALPSRPVWNDGRNHLAGRRSRHGTRGQGRTPCAQCWPLILVRKNELAGLRPPHARRPSGPGLVSTLTGRRSGAAIVCAQAIPSFRPTRRNLLPAGNRSVPAPSPQPTPSQPSPVPGEGARKIACGPEILRLRLWMRGWGGAKKTASAGRTTQDDGGGDLTSNTGALALRRPLPVPSVVISTEAEKSLRESEPSVKRTRESCLRQDPRPFPAHRRGSPGQGRPLPACERRGGVGRRVLKWIRRRGEAPRARSRVHGCEPCGGEAVW